MKERITVSTSQSISFEDADFKIKIDKKRSAGFERAFHEQIEIKCFYDGSSAVLIGDEVYVADEGSIAIVNPYEIHTNVDIEHYGGSYYLLIVDVDFFTARDPFGLDLRHILISEGKRFSRFIRRDERLCAIIKRAHAEMSEKREHYKLVVYSLMSEFFALLLRSYTVSGEGGKPTREGGKRAELIAPALSLIFKEYSRKITLDELAAACNLSKYHFTRLFGREMGMTPFEYLVRYRVSLADMLRRSGGLGAVEIAETCGFTDVSYLYRCYKRIRGVPFKQG